MKTLCLIAVALVLCGCKETHSSDSGLGAVAGSVHSPFRSAKPQPPPDTRPEIACYGDSLTMGAGLDPGQSYPDLLQKELDQRGYRYRVANFGVNGDTTQDGLARLAMVLADNPQIVVLELGANDGLRGQPLEVMRANLERIIQALQKSGARVVLAGMMLPPNYGPAYAGRFQAIYRELAEKYKLDLIPFLLQGVGGVDRLMQRDGLHPNAEGAQMVAATVLKNIEPFLQH
jgi:acyl-CoA thioesterase I